MSLLTIYIRSWCKYSRNPLAPDFAALCDLIDSNPEWHFKDEFNTIIYRHKEAGVSPSLLMEAGMILSMASVYTATEQLGEALAASFPTASLSAISEQLKQQTKLPPPRLPFREVAFRHRGDKWRKFNRKYSTVPRRFHQRKRP